MNVRNGSADQSVRHLPHVDWWAADVLALNVATGVVEAVCIVHLGGVFAAFVTGTMVLAGVHLGSGAGDLAGFLPYAIAFAGFVPGGLIGGALVRNAAENKPRAYARVLVVESGLLVTAAAFFAIVPGSRATDLTTLAALAAAMSMQFSATWFINLPDLRFAAATGLVHGLVHEVTASNGVPARLSRRLLAVLSLPAGAAIGVAIASAEVSAAILVAGLTVLGAALAGHRLGRADHHLHT